MISLTNIKSNINLSCQSGGDYGWLANVASQWVGHRFSKALDLHGTNYPELGRAKEIRPMVADQLHEAIIISFTRSAAFRSLTT